MMSRIDNPAAHEPIGNNLGDPGFRGFNLYFDAALDAGPQVQFLSYPVRLWAASASPNA